MDKAKMIQYVKDQMGFTDKQVTCGDCTHCTLTEKPLDVWTCMLNPTVPFDVDPDRSRCNQYKRRDE